MKGARTMRMRWHPGDLPYGCFLFWGATMLFLMLVRRSYTDAQWENGAGGIVLLFLPVIVLAFVALLVGVVLTFWLWREWPLVVLSVLDVLAVLAVFVVPVPARIQSVLGYTAVVGTCGACVFWVLFVRRRQLRATTAAGGRWR